MLVVLAGNVGRADERIVTLIRDHENDAVVAVLQNERVVPTVDAGDDDVTSLDVADAGRAPRRADFIVNLVDRRTSGVDDGARSMLVAHAIASLQGHAPHASFAACA